MTMIPKAAMMFIAVLGIQPGATGVKLTTNPPTVTVRQVVSMQALAGATVLVSGRCLAGNAPRVAVGSRPYSGDVWQLEDGGAATWVVGPKPAGCSTGSATITARVIQDTQPLFGPARTLRQYLVVK